jgi:SAM-dependent methyltransferase
MENKVTTHRCFPSLIGRVLEQHRRIREPIETCYLDYRFTIFPKVFSPFIAPSGQLGLGCARLPIFKGKRVLEIGCGSGVLACLMALRGGSNVVGIDNNPVAVQNARYNAKQLGIESKVTVLHGNLFEPLDAEEKFNCIFANLPFVSGHPRDSLETAFFDPGLFSVRKYVQQLPQWLKFTSARAYLCLSEVDGLDIPDLIRQQGLNQKTVTESNLDQIQVRLLELNLAT